MKHISALFVALVLCAGVQAADKDTTATARWIDKITVQPVAVARWNDFSGSPDYGAGLAIGAKVNSFVTLSVQNLAYENGDWGGSAIDETALLFQADITRFSNESFTPYFIGGGLRDWQREDWGFSAGLGGRLNFNKNWSIGADYNVTAFFNNPEDGRVRAYLQGSF